MTSQIHELQNKTQAPSQFKHLQSLTRIAYFKDFLGAQDIVWTSPDSLQTILQNSLDLNLIEDLGHGNYVHRSHPSDTARDPRITHIHSDQKGHFIGNQSPADIQDYLPLLENCMSGKTLYVIAGCLGSPDPHGLNDLALFLSDNPYVAYCSSLLNTIDPLLFNSLDSESYDYFFGIHASQLQDSTLKAVRHFTEPTKEFPWGAVLSYGSSYGGNALLFKKAISLRLANSRSVQNTSSKTSSTPWFSYEHMALVEIITPEDESFFFAAAFPSACGKSNFAMIQPPEGLAKLGWKARLLGDDLVRLKVSNGQLYAQATEKGYFMVLAGTNNRSNPVAMEILRQSPTLYTNTFTPDNPQDTEIPAWWPEQDSSDSPQYPGVTWKGEHYSPEDETSSLQFAHPNCRAALSNKLTPNLSDYETDGDWVPLHGILFGGRDNDDALLRICPSWAEGVFEGLCNVSQTTAAEMGSFQSIKHDPFAMAPFLGAPLTQYIAHHIQLENLCTPPLVVHTNWFLKDEKSSFSWPGFGDNLYVLEYLIRYMKGHVRPQVLPHVNGALPVSEEFISPSMDSSLDFDYILQGSPWSAIKHLLHSFLYIYTIHQQDLLKLGNGFPQVILDILHQRIRHLHQPILHFSDMILENWETQKDALIQKFQAKALLLALRFALQQNPDHPQSASLNSIITELEPQASLPSNFPCLSTAF